MSTNTRQPIYKLLPFIILVEGFVSISIEILTIRQLLPVAGGSVIVTSLIIGIFLLFLALGYQRGGHIKQNLHQKLQNNFFIVAIGLGLGLSYSFISIFFDSIQAHITHYLLYSLVIYLLLIIAPLIYLLGQTIPITMNFYQHNKTVSNIGGDALGLSTLGSFLGATVTALVLMHYLGVAWTIVINFMLLAGLALLLCQNFFSFSLHTIFVIFSLGIIFNINVTEEKKQFVLTDNYANYQILNVNPQTKILRINNSNSSSINIEKKGFMYVEMIKKILFEKLKLRDANILVLGAGGFTLSAETTNGNHFTYIDIDDQLPKAVSPHFIENLNSHLIVDDARHFLQQTKNQYAAIVVDAYTNIMSIPSHLVTYQYMLALNKVLIDNGTVIFNMATNPWLTDDFSKRIDNTIRSVFKSCMVLPLDYENKITNILYICRKNINANDKTIYSDNLNTSTTDAL